MSPRCSNCIFFLDWIIGFSGLGRDEKHLMCLRSEFYGMSESYDLYLKCTIIIWSSIHWAVKSLMKFRSRETDVIIIVLLWNLTVIMTALLPMCLWKFKAIGKISTSTWISQLRGFTKSCVKTSYRLVNRCHRFTFHCQCICKMFITGTRSSYLLMNKTVISTALFLKYIVEFI